MALQPHRYFVADWRPRSFQSACLLVGFLRSEQVLLQEELEKFINGAAPLCEDALNAAALGRYPIFEDDPVTTHAQPVIFLQRAFERANVAAFFREPAERHPQHSPRFWSLPRYEADDLFRKLNPCLH